MPVDARIALGVIGPQIDDPLTVQAKQAKLRDLMAQQQMQTMQMEDAQRQRQETMTLNELYRSTGGDSVKIREGLASGGLGSRIPAFDEQQAKLGKVQSEGESAKLRVAKERIDLMAGELSALLARPDLSPQHVIDSLTGLVQRGIIPPEQGAQIARSIPNDPNALRAMLKQSGLQAMEASRLMEMLTPKIDYKQTGKALVPVDTNAFTNPTPRALTMTTTPGEDQSRDVSIRGQNVSAGTAAARLKFDRERDTRDSQIAATTREQGKWQYDAARGGFVNSATQEFKPATQDGKPIEPKGAGTVKLTEDQGKATGWLVQAQNAFKNMQAATDPKQGGDPSAAKPGFNDALAAIPSMGVAGATANLMRSTNRQKFMQGSESLSEALLRAATGAGVNKEESAQKIRELTPVFGESAETTAQKMAAIPLYIESLKVRAGPGAPKAEAISEAAAAVPQDVQDILKKHGRK